MTDLEEQAWRAALRSLARPFILAVERRGGRFRVRHSVVEVRPRGLLTDTDRALLRAEADAVRLLVARRADWYDWATTAPPTFDPTQAFLAQGESSMPHQRRTA